NHMHQLTKIWRHSSFHLKPKTIDQPNQILAQLITNDLKSPTLLAKLIEQYCSISKTHQAQSIFTCFHYPSLFLFNTLVRCTHPRYSIQLFANWLQQRRRMSSVDCADPSQDYVALSNLYASAERWDDVEIVRKEMKARRIETKPGASLGKGEKGGFDLHRPFWKMNERGAGWCSEVAMRCLIYSLWWLVFVASPVLRTKEHNGEGKATFGMGRMMDYPALAGVPSAWCLWSSF
ncbi:hypothetical protein Tsubulata_007076, partial [Turnera subulata]